MSGRSTSKIVFEPNELVLCFEPDPMKARVLYDARVLRVETLQTANKKKIGAYHVHFLGWNASWDRTVPEAYILKASNENKDLMKRLANIAKNTASNKKRKKLINEILAHQLGIVPTIDDILNNREPTTFDSSSDETLTSSSDEDENTNTGSKKVAKLGYKKKKVEINLSVAESGNGAEMSGNENDTQVNEVNESDNASDNSSDDRDADDSLNSLDGDNADDEDAGSQHEKEGRYHLELNIPENLKQKLEDDYYFISEKEKYVSLPAQPNVLQILESFVKHYAVNLLYASAEKQRPTTRDKNGCAMEKNIELRKEVAEGIRIFFDFTLPLTLLYASERNQFEQIMTSVKASDSSKLEPIDKYTSNIALDQAISDPTQPPLNKQPRKKHSTDVHTCDVNGTESNFLSNDSNRITANHKNQLMSDVDLNLLKDCKSNSEKSKMHNNKANAVNSPKNRTSGHSVQNNSAHKHLAVSHLAEIQKSSEKNERRITRHMDDLGKKSQETAKSVVTPTRPTITGRRKLNESVQSCSESQKQIAHDVGHDINNISATLKSPATLNDSNIIKHESESAILFAVDTVKEMAADNIMSWHLIPEEAKKYYAVTPSAVYGAQHLLRLFVKMPEYLRRMRMTDAKRKFLCKQLEAFLEFLSSQEEYFSDSVYSVSF